MICDSYNKKLAEYVILFFIKCAQYSFYFYLQRLCVINSFVRPAHLLVYQFISPVSITIFRKRSIKAFVMIAAIAKGNNFIYSDFHFIRKFLLRWCSFIYLFQL